MRSCARFLVLCCWLVLLAAAAAQYEAAGQQQQPHANSAADPPNLSQIVQAVRRAEKEPAPHLLSFQTDFSANGNSVLVGESFAADILSVQFRFNVCSGIQLHHHSNIEFMQAITGWITVGIIFPNGSITTYNFTSGQAVVIPAGAPHYYLNKGCQPALLVAVWPAGTQTIFELATLFAVPPALLNTSFATGAAPTPKPGFPIIQDPDCLQRCQAAGQAAASAAAAPAASPPSEGR